jgi:hypothetical protein
MAKLFIFLFGAILASTTFAAPISCDKHSETATPLGKLTREDCRDAITHKDVSIWSLDGKRLVYGEYPITWEDGNAAHTLFVLEPPSVQTTGCPDQVFLIDLTGTAPRVFSFGIKNFCSEYHWARWSKKKRSVIALKDNVLFTYVNGKLIPPDDTNSDQIGMPATSAFIQVTPYTVPIPFVKELTLPK